jgi:mannose-1-phosphate guanylyltransferase
MARKSTGKDSDFKHAYAVIMAGGSGTRFWPLSRRKNPKQLLELYGHGALLEQTVDRVRNLIPSGRVYVFTSELIRKEVSRRLPRVPREQIVAEPASRNTAPTIGLAAHEILRRDPEGIMVVLPSDHVIRKPAEFHRVLRAACRLAAVEGRSVLVGLKPTRPETGYGYIGIGSLECRLAGQEIYRATRFTEKPDAITAQRYLDSGSYLWNGGMFVWRASTLLRNLEECKPEMARGLTMIAEAGGARASRAMKRLYPKLERVSIDYAVVEKIPGVLAVAADIGWSDVGSWAEAYELNSKDASGNVAPSDGLCLDSAGNLIRSEGKFVVTVGVQDLVIVETPDALLVCPRQRSQEVGKAVQELERRGRRDLL